VPGVEVYLEDFPNYPLRVVRIGEDGIRRAIWCSDLAQALGYLPMSSRARIYLLAPGTWKAALEEEEIAGSAPA
jgi:hypothetical protein